MWVSAAVREMISEQFSPGQGIEIREFGLEKGVIYRTIDQWNGESSLEQELALGEYVTGRGLLVSSLEQGCKIQLSLVQWRVGSQSPSDTPVPKNSQSTPSREIAAEILRKCSHTTRALIGCMTISDKVR